MVAIFHLFLILFLFSVPSPADIFEDLVSPTVAAVHFLARACAKRKDTLDPVMEACVKILNIPAQQREPSKKDGALHVIGQVAETLLKVCCLQNYYVWAMDGMCVVTLYQLLYSLSTLYQSIDPLPVTFSCLTLYHTLAHFSCKG